MKIALTYDRDADTAYVTFGEARPTARTISPLEDIAIDLDEKGRIVGIEFVTASAVLDSSTFET